VRCRRLSAGAGPEAARALAREVRDLAPAAAAVRETVEDIVGRVAAEGDAAVLALTRELDTGGGEPRPLRVAPEELTDALARLDAEVRAGLELAARNVRAVAEAGLDEQREVTLEQGQRVMLREVPVARAAVYAPGGRAPYPSTVVMGVVTARAAGVEQVAVCAPPGPDGDAHPATLAAAALCGAGEVYRMGGAQAVAALALGTPSVPRVDVLVGPGNLYVQEAKRRLSGEVGIDGFAGPSDVLIVVGEGSDPRLAALDLLAQAEHGPGTVVVAVGAAAAVDAVAAEIERAAPPGPAGEEAACALVEAPGLDAALEVAEAFAPEHLELLGAAEALAPRVRRAGCVFVGASGATAFGDYVAGSNHTLPTGGAARFASGLSTRHFRRRMAEVHIGPAAAALAPAGAALARAEGFPVHARSMEARMSQNGAP
jgi:histidinol dehydrogenase